MKTEQRRLHVRSLQILSMKVLKKILLKVFLETRFIKYHKSLVKKIIVLKNKKQNVASVLIWRKGGGWIELIFQEIKFNRQRSVINIGLKNANIQDTENCVTWRNT